MGFDNPFGLSNSKASAFPKHKQALRRQMPSIENLAGYRSPTLLSTLPWAEGPPLLREQLGGQAGLAAFSGVSTPHRWRFSIGGYVLVLKQRIWRKLGSPSF